MDGASGDAASRKAALQAFADVSALERRVDEEIAAQRRARAAERDAVLAGLRRGSFSLLASAANGASSAAVAAAHAAAATAAHAASAARRVLPTSPPRASTAEPLLEAHAAEESLSSRPGLEELHPAWDIAWNELVFEGGAPTAHNRLGVGGFGEVFLAELRGTPVAVKRLLEQDTAPGAAEAFRREVALLAQLRHPAVVTLIGCVSEPGNLAMVLEHMDRKSLAHVLRRARKGSGPAVSRDTALRWCVRVAEGMAYLHGVPTGPVLHRDICPNNILVNRGGDVKLSDFGMSRVKRRSGVVGASGAMGTVGYAAPEFITGDTHDEGVDVYSWGVVLWELLTGREPWEGYTAVQVMYQLLRGDEALREHFTPPPGAGVGLDAVLNDCIVADPAKRPRFPGLLPRIRAAQASG